MVTPYMFEKVRALIAQDKSDRFIARKLGMNRKTVAKYRQTNAPPVYQDRQTPTKANPLRGFEERIAGLLKVTPTLAAVELYGVLRDEGYTGSLRTVQRHHTSLRQSKPKERFFEQTYEPGEQSQFDFKEKVELPFVDGPRIVHFHFGTLPHSDFFHIKAYGFKNYEAFMDGIHSFFERAGGMSEKIRFDNLSPCVKRVLKGDSRIYTESFEKATSYYGFGLLPCAPGKGSDKGDVEREIKTQALRIKNLVSRTGRIFQDFDDLNEWLVTFCKDNLTQKAKDLWTEEIASLKTLPPRNDDILCKTASMPVNGYGTVRIGKSTYSVPDEVIKQNVRVVMGPYDVKIYALTSKEPLVAAHLRKPDNENSILLAHTLTSLIRKPHAMVRWKHKEILFPRPAFKKYYAFLQKLLNYGAEREFLKTINLIHYATLDEIASAIELVLEAKSETPFQDVKILLLGQDADRHAPHQSPLCPVLSLYDELIPTYQKVSNQ
jgi:transposase